MSEWGATRDWTGLLAGALAHEINNLVHTLSSARGLLGTPAGGTPDHGEPDEFVAGCLDQMRTLAARVRALATVGENRASVRLDDAWSDALAEADPGGGRVVRAAPPAAGLQVRGSPAAVRTALTCLLDYALAASPAAAPVRLAVRGGPVLPGQATDGVQASGGGVVVVEVAAAEVSGLGEIGMARLDLLLGAALRDMRGDLLLVLAGAIGSAVGGAVYLASTLESGLVLSLQLEVA